MIGKAFRRLELEPPGILRKVFREMYWEGTPDSPCMALTFDDGPDPGVTPAVLDVLDEIGAKATFFMVGKQAGQHQGLARDVALRGHLIGNHTMTHQSLFLSRRETVREEIRSARRAIEDTAGVRTNWFRPPHGMFDITSAREFRRQRCKTVLWSALSGDYRPDPSRVIVEQTSPYLRPGAIVVFHDTAVGGGDALPGILRSLAEIAVERGIRFGRVDELAFHRGMVED